MKQDIVVELAGLTLDFITDIFQTLDDLIIDIKKLE